ncbi:MAG TPA: NFACT family protein [Armatimonadota bacterium]
MKAPTFDSLTLRALCIELQSWIPGVQVQKVRQPDQHTIHLRLYGNGRNGRLLLCTHPERFRAHLTTREFSNPSEPPPFCMALRKYLEGGRVISVEQDGADRVLRLTVGGPHGRLQLVAEMMGRHSNVILLDEGGSVLEAIKHVGPKMSHRVILPGRPYPALPPSGKPSLWDAPRESLDRLWEERPSPLTPKWLIDTYGGMSPFLAGRLLTADPDAAFHALLDAARRGAFEPAVLLDGFGEPIGAWPLASMTPPAFGVRPTATISEALDEVYARRTDGAVRSALLHEADAILDREAHVLERRREDLRRIADDVDRAEGWRVMGEILAANAHAVEKGAAAVSLTNYYDPEMRLLVIPLDTTLSPRENAESYFARQRKARAAAERVPEQSRELDAREADLAARRAEAYAADETALAQLVGKWSAEPGQAAPRDKKREPEFPPGVRIRRFTSEEGWPIWVGENATGNDYLTTRASDATDIWFHVRAAASAHAVIKTGKHPERVPPATLQRAAELVAARSEAKASGVIPVDYTLRRYVRKPRNAAPGRVTYEREKTLYVEGR